MQRNNAIQWQHKKASTLSLAGTKVAVIGGTGGIGRALSRLMAAQGADVVVVGRTFRDSGTPRIAFIEADLTLMSEARRVGERLNVEAVDQLIFTNGIIAAPKRQVTPEGIERDLAVSYLSRLVMLEQVLPRLGAARTRATAKPRVFIWGFPGSGQKANIDDLNSEHAYSMMPAHSNTVAGNEALVLWLAERYPHINFYGINPGVLKTNIRGNMLGEDSVKHRAMEWIVGLVTPTPERYATRMVPLLVSPDIENDSGAMFNRKGQAVEPSPVMSAGYVEALIAASQDLINKKVR